MDGSRIRKENVADSKISEYVWTGPKALQLTGTVNIQYMNKNRMRFEFGKSLTKKFISKFFIGRITSRCSGKERGHERAAEIIHFDILKHTVRSWFYELMIT